MAPRQYRVLYSRAAHSLAWVRFLAVPVDLNPIYIKLY